MGRRLSGPAAGLTHRAVAADRWYISDHPPPHVHIFDEKGREIGRFDLVRQRPMDDFELTVKLRRALEEAGFLAPAEE